MRYAEDVDDDWDDEDEDCPFCGDWGCDGSGYNCNVESYNLRDDSMVPPVQLDPDEDGHQRYKDDLAQGLINPDGTQRDPDPPEDHEGRDWSPRTEDGGPDDPWALPEGETYDTEAPF